MFDLTDEESVEYCWNIYDDFDRPIGLLVTITYQVIEEILRFRETQRP